MYIYIYIEPRSLEEVDGLSFNVVTRSSYTHIGIIYFSIKNDFLFLKLITLISFLI